MGFARNRSLDREIVAIALPALGALAADPLLSMVDTALVGHLGAAPLGALGIAVVAFNLAFIVFNFLAYGTTGPLARLLAAGEVGESVDRVRQTFWLAILLGVATTIAGELASEPLGRLLGAEGTVLSLFLEYYRIRLIALTPMLITLVGHGAFRGLQDTRTPLYITIGANLLNAALGYVLIYPAGMGIAGAAVATLVAQSAAAGLFIRAGVRRIRALGEDPLDRPRWEQMRVLLRVSRDLLIRTASLHGSFVVATAVAARTGTVSVAAHQVAIELWMFLAMVLDSVAIAAQALIGRYLGAGSPAHARRVANRMALWGIALGIVLGGSYWLARDVLPGIFTSDPEVLAAVASVFPFIVAFQPLNGYVFVLDGVLLGASDTAFIARAMAASAAAAAPIIIGAPTLGWGLVGVWVGLAVLMVVRALTVGVRFHRGAWAR